MASVVIAAHNEESVIGSCLAALTAGGPELEVIVVPNGCTDRTAAVAASFPGVRVEVVEEAGKANALNVGDARATGFPRVYLDADIVVDPHQLQRLAARTGDTVLAAAPVRDLRATGCALPVRAYAAVHRHLPVMAGSLFGRGLVVVSREGRARFDRFPDLVADDLFLDGLFAPGEKVVSDDAVVVVLLPRTTRELLRRLVRVRRGNNTLRAVADRPAPGASVARSRPTAWLGVVVRRPWLAPAAVVYVALTLAAELGARLGRGTGWGRTGQRTD